MQAAELERALDALGAELAQLEREVHILVVGGAALALRRWIARATDDVDVLAVAAGGTVEILLSRPQFDEGFIAAVRRVARDFGLPADWLNDAVALQWDSGLPPSSGYDIEWLHFHALHVGLASRSTLIALKLFAATDHGHDSVHVQDLVALAPSTEELNEARAWVIQQDALEEFDRIVDQVIEHVRKLS